MLSKLVESHDAAVSGIPEGAIIGIGGFGGSGVPDCLVDALIRRGVGNLTVVTNNAGAGETGIAGLLKAGLVRKLVCSFPRHPDSYVFEDLYRRGRIDLEVVPQGTLVERLRAAGAGIGGFYTRTAAGTLLAKGKEERTLGEHTFVLEFPLNLDFALIKAEVADHWGNLTFRKASRNFGPVMATAARKTVVCAAAVVAPGDLDPETVITPGIYVHHVACRGGGDHDA
jgi:3-oxoadipate CoA-transferase, alpha subunit